MKLTIYNGSPKGKGSNTKILLDSFLRGYTTVCSTSFEVVYLNKTNNLEEQLELFSQSENVIIAFPLYTDAMPAIVKRFIEALEPFAGREDNPDLGFLVQSGFPEPVHSRFVERYLEKLAKRMGCYYKGTIVKGGIEGIKIKPQWMIRKTMKHFYDLGVHFGKTSEFNEKLVKKLASKDKMSKTQLAGFKFMSKVVNLNFYWDQQLKKNKAYSKSFDRPFL